jgi:outer membrane protein assembly factor BamB
VGRKRLLVDLALAVAIAGAGSAVFAVLLSSRPGPKPPAFPVSALLPDRSPNAVRSPSHGNWPTYGYDLARTRFSPAASLRPPYRLKWRHAAGDLLASPPAIYDGGLYICTAHGLVVRLRASDGRVVWTHRVRHAHFASAPTVDATSVYVTSLSRHFLVLDRRTGKRLWGLAHIGPSESSPLLWRRRVFFGDESGTVSAISLATHKVVWRYRTGGPVKGAPAELDGRLVVGSYDGTLYCLTYDGKLLWSAPTGGLLGADQLSATAALAYGTAYIGGTDGHVYAFALGNGGLRWAFATGGWVYSPPAVWHDTVFEGSYDGSFYALSAAAGRVIWKFRAGAAISAAPAVLDGVVYVSSVAGHTWGLNARTGRVVWSFAAGRYSPATADRTTLYVNGSRTLYALVSRR